MIFPNIFKAADLSLDMVKDHLGTIREEIVKQESAEINKAVHFFKNIQNTNDYLIKYGFRDSELPLQTINITKKIIEKISLLYKEPPDRNNDSYLEWSKKNRMFDESLKVAERYKNLLSCVLYRPFFINGVGWRFFIDYEFTPHFHDLDPLNPIAYTIPIKHDTRQVNAKLIHDDWQMFVSEKLFFWFKNGSKDIKYFDDWAPNGEHSLGINPVVLMRSSFPVDSFREPPANDLIESNQSININLNNLNVALHYQAFDQPYITGATSDEIKALKMGPNKLLAFSQEDTTLGLLGYNPKLSEMVDVIKFEFEAISRTYNVNVEWAMSGDVSSGFALVVKNIDLLESRQDDLSLARATEQNIYNVIRAQQEAFSIPDEMKIQAEDGEILNIVFQEINFPINESEDRLKIDWEIKINATTPAKYMMSKYGMDEETALKEIEDNRVINEKLTPRQEEINNAFDEGEEDEEET